MTVKTDVVAEYTSGSGVTIDGVLLKDGLVDGVDVAAPFAGLLATGATVGATAQAQAFTKGLSSGANVYLDVVSAPSAPTLAIGAAGVLNGAYIYQVSAYTATGETALSANSATITPSSQRVTVTIPVSSNALVTGRKLWRSKIGDTTRTYLVADIGNNETATYDDNKADGALGLESHYLFYSIGTSPAIRADTYQLFRDTGLNLAVGRDAGIALQPGAYYLTALGDQAGNANTTGAFNTFVGGKSGRDNTTAFFNTFIGSEAGMENVAGACNTVIGSAAATKLNGGNRNIVIGFQAGDTNTPANATVIGSNNIIIGCDSGSASPTQIENTIIIGNGIAAPTTSNLVCIGNSSVGINYLYGIIQVQGSEAGLALEDRQGGAAMEWLLKSETISGIATLQFRNVGQGLTSFALKRTGELGIGTTTPATRLDIDAGALTMAEMTAPTGVANKATVYAKDNGSGKTQICCKLGDDVEIVMFTQA